MKNLITQKILNHFFVLFFIKYKLGFWIQEARINFILKVLCRLLCYVNPFALLSFLPYCCHSFRIIVIPSKLVSFLLNYCHFKYLSSWLAPLASHTRRVRTLASRACHICGFRIKNWIRTWFYVTSLLCTHCYKPALSMHIVNFPSKRAPILCKHTCIL